MVIARIGKNTIELKLGYKTLLKPKLNCLTVVYGGILGQSNKKICSFLIRKLMEMLSRREIDVIYFNHLKTDSKIFQLSRKIPSILVRDYFPRIENHWSMSIPESLDRFHQKCSKKHRGNLKRYIKTLEKEYPNHVQIITYNTKDDLEKVIKAASQISRSIYQYGLGCGFVDNSRTRVLLTAAAKQNWLRMSVLSINDEPSAFQIGLKYGKQYFLEQIGFDPKWSRFEVGTVLFLKVLEQICANPDIEFVDFGFGDADYKRNYGDKQWQEASVYIFAPRLMPICVNLLQSAIAGVSLGLNYLSDKTGLTRWLKRSWRNRLQGKNQERKQNCEVS